MSDKNIDYLGDEMPPGYEPWSCDVCTAVCNFEAMTMCKRPPDCGFDRDQPESNGGAFGFMKRGGDTPQAKITAGIAPAVLNPAFRERVMGYRTTRRQLKRSGPEVVTARTRDPIPDQWRREADEIEREIARHREVIERLLDRVRWLREAADAPRS